MERSGLTRWRYVKGFGGHSISFGRLDWGGLALNDRAMIVVGGGVVAIYHLVGALEIYFTSDVVGLKARFKLLLSLSSAIERINVAAKTSHHMG